MEVALVRGPYLRPSGVRPWERLHQTQSSIDVTAFASRPARFETDELAMPVEQLDWLDGRFDLLGYDQFFFKALTKFDYPRGVLAGIGHLADEYDIVHTSENFNVFSLQAAIACDRRNTAFALAVGENVPHNPHSVPTDIHKRLVNSRVDGVTATTTQGKRALIHEGVAPSSVAVVPNAVDTEAFRPRSVSPSDAGLPDRFDGTLTILFVHRLCEQKGTPYLLDAFETFSEGRDDVSLVLTGTNDLDRETYARVDERDDVEHIEWYPYEDMGALYSAADVCVLPSVTMERNEEQFGMAVIEAMACGRPTVVTNVGGLPHVVEAGETSLVVEERSSRSLVEAFERLSGDPDLRGRLGDRARDHVRETYAPDVVAEDLRAFYDGLTA